VTPLDLLLVELTEALPDGAGAPEEGTRLEVSSVGLTLPIETRLAASGGLMACAPRGRLATAFQLPIGLLRATFTREER
jgi:hypothetical protein